MWIDEKSKRQDAFGKDFVTIRMLELLGSDDAFRKWIQTQPSCLSGRFSEYVYGEGRCIAAHVRRAGHSGIGLKAPYSCVPLTDDEHQAQHQHGESTHRPKDWWDWQVDWYREEWVANQLKNRLFLTGHIKGDIAIVRSWMDMNDLNPLTAEVNISERQDVLSLR